MSRVTAAGMGGALGDGVQRVEQRAVGERKTRWSARRKDGVLMRLLRGESLDLLARETGQPAGRISVWREEFLAGGREGLKSRPAPVEDRRLAEAQRKVGELTMDLDILRALNDEMDRHPQSPRRSA
jgi:transposase